jgi:hypothetical protein
MSVWDEVKRSVDDISEVAKEVANLLAEKTDEISREGRIKLEIFNLQRQIRGRESKLGRRVFELWSENADADIGHDPTALEHLNGMKDLVAEIEAREKDLASSGGAPEGGDSN